MKQLLVKISRDGRQMALASTNDANLVDHLSKSLQDLGYQVEVISVAIEKDKTNGKA